MGFLDGVLRFFGAEDDEQDNANIVEYPVPPKVERNPAMQRPAEERLITMPDPAQTVVYIVRPERDAKGHAQYNLNVYTEFLQNRQAVIVDLNSLAQVDETEAKRVVDFLTGAVRMVDGCSYEITTNVFVFTPHNVRLAGDPLKPVEVS